MNPSRVYTDNADFLVVEQASPNAVINMYVPKGILSSSTLPESESLSVVSDSLQPHGLYSQSIASSRPEYFPFSRGSSQPRGRTQVSLLQVDSLPAEPPGKP